MAEARIALLSHRQELCEAVRVALSFAGLRFAAAADADALDAELVGDDPARAVLVDLASAPDPAAIAERVRSQPVGADVAVFFLGSGQAAISSTEGALSAGGDAYFALPAEAARVLARLATYLDVALPRIPASLELPAPASDDPPEAPGPAKDEEPAPSSLVGLAPPLEQEPPPGFDRLDEDGDEPEVTAEIDPGTLSRLHAEAAAHRTAEGVRDRAGEEEEREELPGDDDDDDDDEGASDIARRVQRLRSRLAEGRGDLDAEGRTASGAEGWSLSEPSGLVAPEGAEDDDDERRAREAAERGFDALTERITEDDLRSALAGVRELAAADAGIADDYPPLDAMPALELSASSEGAPVPEPPDEPHTGWDPPPLDAADDDDKTTSGFLAPPPTFAQEQDEEREEHERAHDGAVEADAADGGRARDDDDDDDDDVPAPPPDLEPELVASSAVSEALDEGDAFAAVEAALAPPALHFPDAEVGPLLDELGLVMPPAPGAADEDAEDPVTGVHAPIPAERDTHLDGAHEADDAQEGQEAEEQEVEERQEAHGGREASEQAQDAGAEPRPSTAEIEMAAVFDAAAVVPPEPDPAVVEALVAARVEEARREIEERVRIEVQAEAARQLEERVRAAVDEARDEAAAQLRSALDEARREAEERARALEERQQEEERRLRDELEARLEEMERLARAETDEEVQRLADELAREKARAEQEAGEQAALREREREEHEREQERLREQIEALRASAEDARRELEERLQRDADEKVAALARDLAEAERLRREEAEQRQALEEARVQQAEEEARLRDELERALRREADERLAEAERVREELAASLRQELEERVAEAERVREELAASLRRELEERVAEAERARVELEAALRREADERVAEAERAREEGEAALRREADERLAEAERVREELEATLRRELNERVAEAERAAAALAEEERRHLEAARRAEDEERVRQATEAARREAEERLLVEAERWAQVAADDATAAAEAARREAEARLLAESDRRVQAAAAEAAEAARREAEERLLSEAEVLAFEAAEAARRETQARLREEQEQRERALEERLQAAEAAAREAEERTLRVVEEERVAREQAEEALKAREEELSRHRRRWGFRPGAVLGGSDADGDGGASLHEGSGTGASAIGVGRISWWGADSSGAPLGAVTFAPGGELSVEPPPPPESWVALDPVAGELGDGELPSLLWSAHVLEVTGALVLEDRGGLTRTLYLERGEPVGFASDLSRDRPEEALLRAGLITAAKHTELRAGPLRSARRACAHLVDEGALKPQELFTAIRGVLIEQVLSLLELGAATFRYEREAAHAADRVRLQHGFDALLAEGVRRKYDLPRLWRVLGGAQSLVGKDDRAPRLPPLTPSERAALALLDGQRSLEDAVLDGALPAEDVLRAALIGISCGAARVLARGVPGAPVEQRQDHERALAIDKARIEDRLHVARHGDYFAFLGIAPESTSFEVRRAAEHVRRQFDPRRYSDPAFRELKDALDEIRQVADEAEAVLADDALRAGYVRNLLSRRVAYS